MRVLIFCLMLSTAVTASARIGETLQECEQRYGKVVWAAPQSPNVFGFKRHGYLFTIQFREGIAESLRVFSEKGASLSDEEINVFLQICGGVACWAGPHFLGNNKMWVTQVNPALMASYMTNNKILIIEALIVETKEELLKASKKGTTQAQLELCDREAPVLQEPRKQVKTVKLPSPPEDFSEADILLVETWAEKGDVAAQEELVVRFFRFVKKGDLKGVQACLDAGVNVNARDSRMRTAIMSDFHGRPTAEVLKFLIAAGANVDAKDVAGRTALHHLAWCRNTDRLMILIEAGANVNAKDQNGFTTLARGILPVQKVLVDAGADVNARSWDGGTALMDASYNGQFDAVVFLIEHGANVNVKSKKGNSPISFAANALYKEKGSNDGEMIIEYLIDAGADVNVFSEDGFTPLMTAVAGGFFEATRLLMDGGAHLHFRSPLGNTALDIAQQMGKRDIAELLIKHRRR